MERAVTVAGAQVEPVVLDRDATLARLEDVAAEAARGGAELVVFPERSSRSTRPRAGRRRSRGRRTSA